MTTAFSDLDGFRDALAALPQADAAATAAAAARNGQLTKPPAALGRLEDLAIWYAGWRGQEKPQVAHPQIIVFAGNHGVAAQGVSAFPPEVTAQMVVNFRAWRCGDQPAGKDFRRAARCACAVARYPDGGFHRGPGDDRGGASGGPFDRLDRCRPGGGCSGGRGNGDRQHDIRRGPRGGSLRWRCVGMGRTRHRGG